MLNNHRLISPMRIKRLAWHLYPNKKMRIECCDKYHWESEEDRRMHFEGPQKKSKGLGGYKMQAICSSRCFNPFFSNIKYNPGIFKPNATKCVLKCLSPIQPGQAPRALLSPKLFPRLPSPVTKSLSRRHTVECVELTSTITMEESVWATKELV
jgi:hypothetical protein